MTDEALAARGAVARTGPGERTISTGANATFAVALAEIEQRYAERRPRGRAASDAAKRYLPGGNTRSVLFFPPFPLFVAESTGCRLRDLDGHWYVDFVCEYTAGLAGHDHPIIRAAIERALASGWVNGAQLEAEGRLAETLCNRFPSLERVRFCNSGTEANLFALTTARVVTGRDAIMAFRGAYHGGVLLFQNGPSPQNAPFSTVIAPYNDAEATRALIREHNSRLAAVIVEPMLGSGGCIPAEADFLRMLRQECTRQGIILVFDEVMTSRLAPGGLQEAHGVLPDLTTLGKYIGGGLSFGAFGGRADILDRYDPSRPDALMHAGTFNNNPFTMAAGLAAMTEVYTPARAVALNAAGDTLRERLQAFADSEAFPIQFTGRGSMMATHIASSPVTSPEGSIKHEDAQAAKALIHMALLERGHYTARRGMIVLSLPMGQTEHDGLVHAFEDVIDAYRPLFERLLQHNEAASR